MASYADSLQQLLKLREDSEKWRTGRIGITVSKTRDSAEEKEINLIDTLGHNKYAPRPGKRDDDNCYWLPPDCNQNTEQFRVDVMYPIFVVACRDAGFKVICRHRTDCKTESISVYCNRGVPHDEQRNALNNERRKEREREKARKAAEEEGRAPPKEDKKKPPPKPTKKKSGRVPKADPGTPNEDLCLFRFSVFWDSNLSRWFLPKKQSGCADHRGHTHIDPRLLRMPIKMTLPEEEQQVAVDCHESYVSTSATTSLIETRTGETFDWHQVHYLKSKEKNRLVMEGRAGDAAGEKVTAADRLIAYLSSDPRISYTMLFAHYKSNLLTIKKRSKTVNHAQSIEEEFTADYGDLTETPLTFAETKRASLRNSANGELLLAAAWTNDEARRQFDMFPEFLGSDDTEDTNSEERVLFNVCGKNNENQTYTPMRCFLPSKAQWAYSWAFEDAFPSLHPGTALERVESLVSDACPRETRASENIVGNGKKQPPEINVRVNVRVRRIVMPLAKHGWCGFHRIDRDFTSSAEYKSMLAAAKDSSIFSRIEIDVIVTWLWYFIHFYETAEEIWCAEHLMQWYMNEKDQSEHFGEIEESTRKAICVFLTKQFFIHRQKLFEAHFDGMTMGNRTTGINEADHRAVKYHTAGPRPGHDLAESSGRMEDIDRKKNHRKAKKAAYDQNATYGKAEDREKRVQEFSDYCNDQLVPASEDGQRSYLLFRHEDLKFYVKRDYEEYDTTTKEDLDYEVTVCANLLEKVSECLEGATAMEKRAIRQIKEKLLGRNAGAMPEYKKIVAEAARYIIPRFERTREVEIRRLPNGDLVLICSCPCWRKNGYACRHMYAVLRRYPAVADAKIRWHSGYRHNYGRHQALTEQYMILRDRFGDLPGIVITEEELAGIRSSHAVGEGDRPLEYFTRSLGKLFVRGSDSYWPRNAHKLPGNLRQCFECMPLETEGMAEDASVDFGGSEGTGDIFDDSNGANIGSQRPLVMGATSQVHHGSSYQVPSQTQRNEGNYVSCPPQGKDAYSDLMAAYIDLCKRADANGDVGRKAALDGINDLRAEQDEIADGKPIKSRKRKPIRKQKCTSPPKKGPRKF